jgi:hypothetical protein
MKTFIFLFDRYSLTFLSNRYMRLTNGTGSCYFRQCPSRCHQKTIFCKVFLLISFKRYIYIICQRQKVKKKSQNSRNQCFAYYFCLMVDGFGSVPLTYGSGSGSRMPKNIRIPRIRIRNSDTFRARVPIKTYPGCGSAIFESIFELLT